jgi:hypothetical protein
MSRFPARVAALEALPIGHQAPSAQIRGGDPELLVYQMIGGQMSTQLCGEHNHLA